MTARTSALAAMVVAALGIAVPAIAENTPTTLPNGVYAVHSGTAISVDAYQASLHPVSFSFTDGRVRLDYACLPYGTASATTGKDGTWAFAQATLSTKGCPKDVAGLAAESVVALTQGTSWRPVVDEGAGTTDGFVVSGPRGTLRLAPATARTAGPDPSEDPSTSTPLTGEWRVEGIERTGSSRAQESGPYSWIVKFGGDAALFPDGSQAGYAATPSGAFVLVSYTGVIAAAYVPGPSNEWSDVRGALAATTRWSLTSPTTAVFTGPGVRAVLSRPAPTNRAFTVKAIEPSVRAVRVAVGQTVRVPVAAEPLALRATGKAPLTWRNARTAIVDVTTASEKTKPAKSGAIAVPMNGGDPARLRLTGAKRGTSTVTLTAASGAKSSIKVKVVRKRVPVTKVTITAKAESWRILPDGRYTLDLDAKIRPARATVGGVEWTSSAPSLATVSPTGLVTWTGQNASAQSKVTITARSGGAKATYTCTQPLLS
ncbi:MAG: Ig-like domain-containing protein [Bifidobacteriaceae bacterium]|jgi:hypothetical protein|nr:Ig-like domain-containing protein [Bifidobacteriaceae bacterium]